MKSYSSLFSFVAFWAFPLLGESRLWAAPLEEWSQQAQVAHGKRALNEASALYDRILAEEPPRLPTAAEQALVTRYAPRLFHPQGEFFGLKDIVAIVHPEKPVIAYHLFWEDDYGFPSDNDPCDHEIVWVTYAPDSGKVTQVSTYFHGHVITTHEAVEDANRHNGRPWIGIEWGFHGSTPLGAIGNVPYVDATLDRHWKRASQQNQRPRDPLARGWPERYSGSFEAYSRFEVAGDLTRRLQEENLMYVSRWANATLNRYCLRYNFSAKLEWPWQWQPKPARTPSSP